jgi:UDP-glucuronate 4-epimerase
MPDTPLTALVTGAAGFIGYHVCQRLIRDGYRVVGFDAMNDYYDVQLKRDRLKQLVVHEQFSFVEGLLEADGVVMALFAEYRPDVVVHLAAQAGVRWSIENPRAYLDSNLIGVFNMLEAARAHKPAHMLMASTSSAFGANTQMPYVETQRADHQMSFYAATKKANEAMAHSYAHLYDIPITMFRFFTVYGTWSRPDMAPILFTKAILAGDPINIYNHGDMRRDFTYVDDLVHGLRLLIDVPPVRPAAGAEVNPIDSLSPVAPHRVINIGNGESVKLMDFIAAIEEATGIEAKKNFMDMQPGDVPATWANTDLLQSLTGYQPQTTVRDGVAKFVEWYRSYYDA